MSGDKDISRDKGASGKGPRIVYGRDDDPKSRFFVKKIFSAQMREKALPAEEVKTLYNLPRKREPKSLRRYLRYHYLRMLRLPGTAYSVALPMAFGIAIMFFPTFGFRAPITLLFAYLAKVNKTAGVIASVLVTPLAPLCYTLDLLLGGILARGNMDIKTIASQTNNAMQNVQSGIISLQHMAELGINFLFACMILSAIAFIILFTLFFFLIRSYQKRKTKNIAPEWHAKSDNKKEQ